jgi:hypothetical protein
LFSIQKQLLQIGTLLIDSLNFITIRYGAKFSATFPSGWVGNARLLLHRSRMKLDGAKAVVSSRHDSALLVRLFVGNSLRWQRSGRDSVPFLWVLQSRGLLVFYVYTTIL